MKAEYVSRYQQRDDIYLTYKYRGMQYEVHENRVRGNETLSWQHRSEQDRIDRVLDTKCISTEPAEIGLELFFKQYE